MTFVDLSGLTPGSGLWLLGAGLDVVITVCLPLMVGGIVAPLTALWFDR